MTKRENAAAPELVRLNVVLQDRGVASRRKADELIAAGKVEVDGVVITTLGTRVNPRASIRIGGKNVALRSTKKVIYLFHKPILCLTTRSDPFGRPTVFDLPGIKKLGPGVQSVGRLDFKSEGLLLLTNDGDLAYALTHPRFKVEKNYWVLVSEQVRPEQIERLKAGIPLEDGMAKAVSARPKETEMLGSSRGQWIEIVVDEGRNRLIRRMMEHLGLRVVRLVRKSVGEIRLPRNLAAGQYRIVNEKEQRYLAGLLETVSGETPPQPRPAPRAAAGAGAGAGAARRGSAPKRRSASST